MHPPHRSVILGIESSCDDTAAAVVTDGRLRSTVVSSQLVHMEYGGVVPELASRAHQQLIVPVVEEALREAGLSRSDVDAVAVTYGPGLAGSLLVGVSFAKAYAFGLDVPLIGVNHLEGHIYSVFLNEEPPSFPYLCLIVSGGHTQLVVVEDGFTHRVLGTTRDDAAGEAFDKVAKLLDLGYPGGPVIDRLARSGDPAFHDFPRSRPGTYDFSFSGLKTSVLYYLNGFDEAERSELIRDRINDLCASFQQAVVDVLTDVLDAAIDDTGVDHVAIVGGVSANTALRTSAERLAASKGVTLHVPAPEHCVDNGAMIAITGHFKLAAGLESPLSLTAEPGLKL
ncbi:MAG: tRNA (adenosine(37)-N6)-threonylcarbamoyltransferase complex transferase subunit TsaD [Rhodothermales bacterium]